MAPLEKQKNARADRFSDRFEVRETTIQRNLVAVEKKGLGTGIPTVRPTHFRANLFKRAGRM